jgi:heme a synthase
MLRKWVACAFVLTLAVILLGAYVRLSDAGLGCPDWPGCYGNVVVPDAVTAEQHPDHAVRPLETGKAWKEMVHRYFASALGAVVASILVASLWLRRRNPNQPVMWPILLSIVVILQAALGMWTVTLLLKPVVVVGHLLGGFTTLTLVVCLYLALGSERARIFAEKNTGRWPFRVALVAIALLVLQIALGGWTSSNYAALACTDFPTCQHAWKPETNFAEAFTLWRGLGVNYEFGVLDSVARVTIHWSHRVGALLVFMVVGALSVALLWAHRAAPVRRAARWVVALLLLQVGLGVSNVVLSLPLWVAVAHNGVAALLLVSLVSLAWRLRQVSA